MIAFFRNIRKGLLGKANTQKYLLYAIGEITLVVIGILIALQINNWNEGRKKIAFEREILRDIYKGLELNIWQLEQGINSCESAANSCQIILRFLDDEINYHDSLIVHFSRSIRWFRPTVTNTGYESLKAYGRHLIRNDSIRDQLEVYDYEWIHVLHDRQEQFYNTTVSPVFSKLFTSATFSLQIQSKHSMKPFDVAELKRSREYFHIVNTLKSNREGQAWWYNNWLESIKKLSVMVNKELI
jgi:hypothetical protein